MPLVLGVLSLATSGCPGRSTSVADSAPGNSDTPSEDVTVRPDADVPADTSLDEPNAADGNDTLDTAFDGADVNLDSASDVLDDGWSTVGDGGCRARQQAVPVQTAVHVDPDAGPIVWNTNPPSSGPHYPIWARWGAFPDVPPGYWVHNLEHGGVAVLYRCPSGACNSTISALQATVDTFPTDPACMPTDAAPARVRVVITRFESLDSAIAASAWGWLYAADCIDVDSLRTFYMAHAGNAPENFCGDGYYPP